LALAVTVEWLCGLVASIGLLAFSLALKLGDAKRHVSTLKKEIESMNAKLQAFENQQIATKAISTHRIHEEQGLADQLNESIARE
jgi:hypothetical protein